MKKKIISFTLILMILSILSFNCSSPSENENPADNKPENEDLSNETWNSNIVLDQKGDFPFAGLYKYNVLTISDNIEVTSKKISQLVICVNTLNLGRNVTIRVRNGYYKEAPINIISDLNDENLTAMGKNAGKFYLYENMFGNGGNGGNGENGGTLTISSTFYGDPGGGGGGGFGGGIGGSPGTRYGKASKGMDNGGNGGSGSTGYTTGRGGYSDDLGSDAERPPYFNQSGSGGGGNGGKGSIGGEGSSSEIYTIGGSGGGGGGYGGGILTIVAKEIKYEISNPPKFIVSGQQGGKGGAGAKNGENGEGGLIIIDCPDISFSSSFWNLNNSTLGKQICPSQNGGHGIVTGNPQKVFINGKEVK